MCGRFGLYSTPEELAGYFNIDSLPDIHPRYNIAPTQDILIVRVEEEQRCFANARWGLVPHWAKDIGTGYNTINARAETVESKPAYRDAFKHRRCLIPSDGFFEWQPIPGSKKKQPWFITGRDHKPMAFAGLWEQWRNPEGEVLDSCSIIVTEAIDLIKPIHDRMPVILSPDVWGDWLDPGKQDINNLKNILKPSNNGDITFWQVGSMVNNARNNTAECIAPVGES